MAIPLRLMDQGNLIVVVYLRPIIFLVVYDDKIW